jgi:N-acetylmuramoyl-L-alanine amidase
MKKLLSILLVIIITGCHLSVVGFSSPVNCQLSIINYQSSPTERRHYLPGNMRGVIIRPDIHTGRILDHVFDDLAGLGMNTVIIATSDDENIYYNTDFNKSDEPDRLSAAIDTANRLGFNVYLTFSINAALFKSKSSGDVQSALNALITEIHKFTLKYHSDGIILTDYYTEKNEDSFRRYMGFGAGIGYDNWLYESTESFFKTVADTIRLTDNSVPVGIMLDNFSNISADGGFADTRRFIENGHADFAVINAKDALSTAKTDIPFDEFTGHWGKICESSDIPMYVIHHNQKIGRPEYGADWNKDDQLLRQLSVAKETPAYNGSIFFSHPDLMENRLKSTDNIQKFFNDQINEETLFEGLTMHSPRSLNFTTNDAFAIFQGSYDDNFEVSLNNQNITLNAAGNFYLERPLNVGMNVFTLRHKGETITYRIERRVISLHSIDSSIANGRTLEVEGGTIITISAVAYRGATVTATVNGQNVRLTQQDRNLDDAALNISYAPFVGTYTVPAGIVGQTQSLGTITVSANFNGYVRSEIGANVRITALPEPPVVPPVHVELIDQHNAGTGEVVGTIGAIRTPDQSARIVRVLNNNTPVLPGNTTGSIPDPNFSRLPAGTVDYFRSTAGNFHITDSGKRIHTDNAVVENGTGFGENNLVLLSGGSSGRNSFFQIKLDHRTSFNISAAGLNFTTARGNDHFNLSEFNATHIHIDFDNVTSVTALPSFENNVMFSGGRWETPTINGVPKFRMVLELRRRGVYGGNFAQYNSEGNLMLTFRNITQSLTGMTIVIDPGHGRTASGGFDPGAIGQIREWDANIAVARKLRDRLAALGANAHILPTETEFISAFEERNNRARTLGADLYISLHTNAAGVGNTTAKGQEVWYFTPFSQPLALAITNNISAYFQNNVYADGVSRNRGAKYSFYAMTLAQDFPSVMVELGFVANMEDAMALANETHQTGIANAIAAGIQQYLGR